MRKDVVLSVTLDRAAADALRELADVRAEGNKSFIVRTLVREEVARLSAQQEQTSKEARHDQ